MSNWVSLRAYARHKGCKLSAVQKAVKSGRVTAVKRHSSGRLEAIDQELADQQWTANTDPAQVLKQGMAPTLPVAAAVPVLLSQPQRAGQLEIDPAALTPEAEPPPEGGAPAERDRDPHGYFAARAEREKFQAKSAELDYHEQLGKLVNVEEVEREQFEIFRQLRDNLLLIGPRVSQRFAAETDPLRIEQQLNEQIKAVLNEHVRTLTVEPAGGATERAEAGS